jgi:hypothetical protein
MTISSADQCEWFPAAQLLRSMGRLNRVRAGTDPIFAAAKRHTNRLVTISDRTTVQLQTHRRHQNEGKLKPGVHFMMTSA